MKLVQLCLFVLGGAVLASLTRLDSLTSQQWYMIAIGLLLATGLYASTYGIELREARHHKRIILSAITVGVLLKALIIGVTLALVFQNPYYAVLGVAVAQIDPLSVSALMRGTRLSGRAKTILASWASFDDPVTVILCLYAPLVVTSVTGHPLPGVTEAASAGSGVAAYLTELAFNLSYAAGAFVLWMVVKRYAKHAHGNSVIAHTTVVYAFIVSMLAVAAYYFWMLGVAVMGLFVRPAIERFIDAAVSWALKLAALLLGMLLVGGINVVSGVALGVMAFTAQVIVGFLLTHGLGRRDRVHIAFAQQNGITAIILALLFEAAYPGTVGIVAPAILVVNILHEVTNRLIDKRFKLAEGAEIEPSAA